eukprot:jgi/Botrbrau1/22060/Bobra.0024s0069.1
MASSFSIYLSASMLVIFVTARPVPVPMMSPIPVSGVGISTPIMASETLEVPTTLAPTGAADANALSSTVSDIVQSAVAATATVVQDAARGGGEALYDSAPVVQADLAARLAELAAEIPTATQTVAAGMRALAPLAPDMGPAILASVPTISAITADALTGLASLSAAAVPAVAPAMRTTGATEARIVAASAPTVQTGLIHMTPALSGAMSNAMASIRQMPAFASGVTPLFIGGMSSARTPAQAPRSSRVH